MDAERSRARIARDTPFPRHVHGRGSRGSASRRHPRGGVVGGCSGVCGQGVQGVGSLVDPLAPRHGGEVHGAPAGGLSDGVHSLHSPPYFCAQTRVEHTTCVHLTCMGNIQKPLCKLCTPAARFGGALAAATIPRRPGRSAATPPSPWRRVAKCGYPRVGRAGLRRGADKTAAAYTGLSSSEGCYDIS